jgi:hypothetical protein
MQITENILTLLQKCYYPFETIKIQNEKVLKHFPTVEDVLDWLRGEDVYITALPFRDAEEGPELYYYYSVIDLNDFNDEDDILCSETHLGVSEVDYTTYQEAITSGIESYLKFKSKDIRQNRETLLVDIMEKDQKLGLYD